MADKEELNHSIDIVDLMDNTSDSLIGELTESSIETDEDESVAPFDMEDDGGVYSPSRKTIVLEKLKKNRITILFFTCLCLVVCTLLIGVLVTTLSLTLIDKPFVIPEEPDPNGEFVRNSSEYQITYANIDDWIDRDAMVESYLEVCNRSPLLDISMDDGKFSARIQYKLITSGETRCYNNREIRVRDYISGYNEGTSYVDIKSSSTNLSKACDVPFWPADEYLDDSRQKCETDIHQCKNKFSRETRIFFDEAQELVTCRDLLHLYPWAFDELPEDKQLNEVDVDEDGSWWIASFKGMMDDTNYEMSFTLKYETSEDAISGDIAPIYGEWSIRIYTEDDGGSDEYNPEVQNAAYDLWINLSETFGNSDSFGDCDEEKLIK